MKKIRLLALLLAVITAGALFFFLGLSGNKSENMPKANVIVAAADIPENTVITAEMLKLVSIPVGTVLSNTYSKTSDVIGKTTNTKIMSGEQILSIRLVKVGSTDSGTLAYSIKPGMRAITIGIGDTSSLKYMIKPNDIVDIVAQYQVENLAVNKTVPVAKLLMQKIKVLAVDQVMQKSGSEKYTTLTLEVTPEQAVKISFSENAGLLRAILRSPLDTGDAPATTITINEVIN